MNTSCSHNHRCFLKLSLELNRDEIQKLRKNICNTSDLSSNRYEHKIDTTRKERKTLSKEEFLALYNEFKGNKSELARHLGVDRTTVWRKLKKYTDDSVR